MKYLNNEDMNSLVTLVNDAKAQGKSPTQQFHINHVNCSAGIDTKRRLYGKVTDDGATLLAYCQHCGAKGARTLTRLSTRLSETTNDTFYGQPRSDVKPLTTAHGTWMFWQRAWDNATPMGVACVDNRFDHLFPLSGFTMFPEDIKGLREHGYYGMRIHDTLPNASVLIPRMGESGLLGLDVRRCDPDKASDPRASKWRRVLAVSQEDKEVAGRLIIYNNTGSRIGVLVEDPISAMKVDIAGFGAVAVTGSSLASDDAFKLSMLFDMMVVWLDNDSAHIISEATAAAARMQLFGTPTAIVGAKYRDPKTYSSTLIRSVVECAVTETIR